MKRVVLAALVLVLPLVGVGAVRTAKVPLCGRLSSVQADAELKAEMARYGLKAYSYTDGTNTLKALHYAPKPKGTRVFPMVIYIPGSGERGDLIKQFRQRTVFDRVTAEAFQKEHPCHLLALAPPETVGTLSGGAPGRPNVIQRLMHDFVLAVASSSKAGVDRRRLYLTGLSYGAAGAYALGLNYPGEYAAVVPISTVPPRLECLDERHPGNWWHFHNEGDYRRFGISTERLKLFQDKAIAAGGDFRVGGFHAEGHDAWPRAWGEAGVWEWMFSKSLGTRMRGRPDLVRNAAKRPNVANLSLARCSASVAGKDVGSGPESVLDGLDSTAYTPEHAFTKEDWWMVQFDRPVSGKFEILSGDKNGQGRLRRAMVEVSTNGKTWVRAGTFSQKDGSCTFVRGSTFTYLRVRTLDADGQEFALRKLTHLAAR